MVQRGAAGVLRVAVSLWPAEERHWGRAICAELDEVEGAWNSVAWAAGGVAVWMRVLTKSFLQSLGRPLGVGADPATQELLGRTAGVPRTPRWATAALVLAALAVLCLPETRQGLGLVFSTWWPAPAERDELTLLRRLAQQGEERHDAPMLAFVSMQSYPGPENARWAEEAVRLDPSLTWIYYGRLCHELGPAGAETIERLRKWDPGNAAVELLAADRRLDILSYQPGGYRMYAEGSFFQDEEWAADMARAFAAPRFDAYFQRTFDLQLAAMREHGLHQPLLALQGLFRLYGQGESLYVYARHLIGLGEQAEKRGALAEAADDYWRVAHFAERMRAGDGTNFEKMVAARYQRTAYQKLQPLARRMGREDLAGLLGYQLKELKALPLDATAELSRMDRQAAGAAWTGTWVHLIAVFIIVLAAFAAFSLIAVSRSKSAPAAAPGWVRR